jgi:hypothetical protein
MARPYDAGGVWPPAPTPPSMRVRTRRLMPAIHGVHPAGAKASRSAPGGTVTKVEHTMTLGIAVGTHPKRTDGYQALAFQPIIRHPGLCRQGLRQVPVAFAANRRQNRMTQCAFGSTSRFPRWVGSNPRCRNSSLGTSVSLVLRAPGDVRIGFPADPSSSL